MFTADESLVSSLNFYRSASYALLISLLVSMFFNFLSCCCYLMQRTWKSEQVSVTPSAIEMSHGQSSPAHVDVQSSDLVPSPHNAPLSVPTSNSWQSKFKSLTLTEEDSEEDLHRMKVTHSPIREENDEEDASESEQFLKSPPSRSKSEESTGGFFGSALKSSKSKSKSSSAQPPVNWRQELETEEKAKSRISFQADDGEHNPTSGGWLRRKKKSTKKKEGREIKESTNSNPTIRRDSDEEDIEKG